MAVTACGLDGEDRAAADALAQALPSEYDGLTPDQASCIGEHWVTEIGRPALRTAGILGAKNTVAGNVRDARFSADQASRALKGLQECTDLDALVAGMVVGLFEADAVQVACIRGAVTSDAAAAWVTSDLQGEVTDNIYVVAGRGCMSTEEQDSVATASLTASLGRADGLTKEQARCVAGGLVETIGTYELTAAGVLDDQQRPGGSLRGTPLNATDAELAAQVIAACVSVEEMLTRSMAGRSGSAARKVRACLESTLDDETFHAYLVATLMARGNGLDAQATKQLADCLKLVVEKRND